MKNRPYRWEWQRLSANRQAKPSVGQNGDGVGAIFEFMFRLLLRLPRLFEFRLMFEFMFMFEFMLLFEFIFMLSPVFVVLMLPEFMFSLVVVVVAFALPFVFRFLFPWSHLKKVNRANVNRIAGINRMISLP